MSGEFAENDVTSVSFRGFDCHVWQNTSSGFGNITLKSVAELY